MKGILQRKKCVMGAQAPGGGARAARLATNRDGARFCHSIPVIREKRRMKNAKPCFG